MLFLLTSLILNLSATPPAAATKPKYHWVVLGCGGGTVDVWVSAAASVCFDAHGTRYTALYGGTGFGGIVAVSAFTFVARLREEHAIEGRYSGVSVSGAWKWGAGGGVFTRNQGEDAQSWWPSLKSDEYVLWLAGHRGYAFDLSGLTLTIVKH